MISCIPFNSSSSSSSSISMDAATIKPSSQHLHRQVASSDLDLQQQQQLDLRAMASLTAASSAAALAAAAAAERFYYATPRYAHLRPDTLQGQGHGAAAPILPPSSFSMPAAGLLAPSASASSLGLSRKDSSDSISIVGDKVRVKEEVVSVMTSLPQSRDPSCHVTSSSGGDCCGSSDDDKSLMEEDDGSDDAIDVTGHVGDALDDVTYSQHHHDNKITHSSKRKCMP